VFAGQLKHRASLTVALALFASSCGQQPVPAPAARKQAPARITQFYTTGNLITEGEEALLCYGTENAGWVKLDPPVEKLTPSLSRCFKVKPAATTRYTLFVDRQQQTVEIRVNSRAAKPPDLIRYFLADPMEARPGQQVTLCYGVKEAVSVELQPVGRELPPAERQCIQVAVARTTTFSLKARAAAGSASVATLTVKVKE
jgi:hypothetical protein